jgi:excisionase family DNA binding protein
MSDEWLSLSEAAKFIGVHPSTVRSWADQGRLPVYRTQGRHRRFRQSELTLWMKSQQASGPVEASLVVQNALKQTRLQISEGRLEKEEWYRKLDSEEREQYSQSGRALLQGLISYLSSSGPVTDAEARSLGYEYASRGRRGGLSSVEATRAFLFFRNLLIESLVSVYETAGVLSPHAWGDMLRKINTFTDQILITLLETYEAYQRRDR